MNILRGIDESVILPIVTLLETKQGRKTILKWASIAVGVCIAFFCCYQLLPRFSRWADASHRQWEKDHAAQIQDAQSAKKGDVIVFKGRAGACLVGDVEDAYLACMILRGSNGLGHVQMIHFNGGDIYFLDIDHFVRYADSPEKWTNVLRELLYIDDQK